MPDKCFLDSNLLIYFSSDKGHKMVVLQKLFQDDNEKIISLQTLNEFINVCFKKELLAPEEIKTATHAFMNTFKLVFHRSSTINKAIEIKMKYKYSYYDCLVIATALEAGSVLNRLK